MTDFRTSLKCLRARWRLTRMVLASFFKIWQISSVSRSLMYLRVIISWYWGGNFSKPCFISSSCRFLSKSETKLSSASTDISRLLETVSMSTVWLCFLRYWSIILFLAMVYIQVENWTLSSKLSKCSSAWMKTSWLKSSASSFFLAGSKINIIINFGEIFLIMGLEFELFAKSHGRWRYCIRRERLIITEGITNFEFRILIEFWMT